ncbi:MFS transporter [Paraburkholderia xenovorans]
MDTGASVAASDAVLAGAARSENVYRKVTLRIVPLLFLCYILAFMDRVNVGFAKLQMANDLGFSDAVYGFGAGIFFVGYFLFEVPGNILLHNVVGARRWIARIMISWGVISAAMAVVRTQEMFYLLRFLLGVAEAGFFPGVLLYITYWFPVRRHGRVMSLFATSVPIAGVIGGPLSGWILRSMSGVSGLQGWQWLFILEGLPSVLLGIVVLMRLDNKITDANWLSAEEKAVLKAQIDAEQVEKHGHSIGEAFRNRHVWQLAAVNFGVAMGVYGISFWLPTILHSSGLHDLVFVGFVSAVPWLVAVLAMVLVGRSADRRGERRWHTAAPALIGAVALAASVVFAAQAYVAIAMLTVATAGVVAAFPQLFRIPAKLFGGAAAATSLAIVGSVGNLSGFVGPYMIGLLKTQTGSTGAGMYGVVAVVLIAVVLVLRLRPSMVNDARKSGL